MARAQRAEPAFLEASIDTLGIAGLAAATALGLQETRVLLSGVVWVIGETAARPLLGVAAVGPFLGVALAGVFLRTTGPRRGLALTGAWLAVARLAEQSSANPMADILLSALCVVLWGWYLVAVLVTVRRGAALGLVLGAAIDLALRLVYLTVDLPWTDHPTAALVTIALAGVAGLGAGRSGLRAESTGEPRVLRLLPLAAVGPWLAVVLLVTGNPSQVMAATGMSFGATAGALGIGYAVAIQLLGGMLLGPPMSLGLTVLGAAAALAFLPLWSGWPAGPLWAALAAASPLLLLAGALQPVEMPAERASASRTSLCATAGLVSFVGLAYLFYDNLGPGWPIAVGVGALALLGLSGAVAAVLGTESPPAPPGWIAPAVALGVLLIGTGRALLWSEPVASGPAPSELTVMAFNIRAGFGSDNRWDLERVAQAIEEQAPDVVVLNEITRGWLIATGADEALWLSRRLNMPAFFGPAAGDLQGNLLLTRYRADVRAHRFVANAPAALPRQFLEGVVEAERGSVVVLGTHLHYLEGGGNTRRSQVEEVLKVWAGRRPAILLGDFNAEASSPDLAAVEANGFVDAPALAGVVDPTWPVGFPVRRIDHVFVTPDVRVLGAHVARSEASDHRPVIARLRV